jgi:hypothetical protein
MDQKQKGFSALALLLLLMIVSIVIFTGWYVWNAQRNSEKTLSQTNNSDIPAQSKKPAETANKEVPLKEYSNAQYGISFKYPENWKLTDNLEDKSSESPVGDVYVVSPNETKVNFNLNQIGRGGSCGEGSENIATTHYCLTVQYSDIAKLETPNDAGDLYFYHVKVADSDAQGGKVHYDIGLSDRESGQLPTTSTLTAIYLSKIDRKTGKFGNIETTVTGKDDDKKISADYFKTKQVEEATAILKSVTVHK